MFHLFQEEKERDLIEIQNRTILAPECPPHCEQNLDVLIPFSAYINSQLI